MNSKKLLQLIVLFALIGCGNGKKEADAFGNFEQTKSLSQLKMLVKLLTYRLLKGIELRLVKYWLKLIA